MSDLAFDRQQTKVNISCVVDRHPRFKIQAWNWLNSLKAIETNCNLFIHFVDGALNKDAIAEFEHLGARLIPIAPFGAIEKSRFCNKIGQLDNTELLDADFVILSDADLVFLKDPSLLARSEHFRAKTVDLPNPPQSLWSELLKRTGLQDRAYTVSLDLRPDLLTFATNFNGGLYVMPSSVSRKLGPLWRRYAQFCLAQEELLGHYVHHSDQLGMGLAILESGVTVDPLPAGANLPTHLPTSLLSRLTKQEVVALHYHTHVDQHGLPRRVGINWIDAAITEILSI